MSFQKLSPRRGHRTIPPHFWPIDFPASFLQYWCLNLTLTHIFWSFWKPMIQVILSISNINSDWGIWYWTLIWQYIKMWHVFWKEVSHLFFEVCKCKFVLHFFNSLELLLCRDTFLIFCFLYQAWTLGAYKPLSALPKWGVGFSAKLSFNHLRTKTKNLWLNFI